jgi:hypothetical protein
MTLHPAPVEARLLTKVFRTPTIDAPRDGGVAVPGVTPPLSPAAPAARAAAIAANPGTGALPSMPRRVLDQRDTESCVSCALSGAMEARNADWPALGPVFHYHVTRFINGGADSSGRLFLDRGLATLTTQGICREADHESMFSADGINKRPTTSAFSDAITRRIQRRGLFFRYQAIGGSSRSIEIRRHLREHNPVVLTLTLPMGYPSSFLNGKHEWLDANNPAPSGSRHCVLVAGFDDLRGAIRIVDSKGSAIFDGGMWWMGYSIVDSQVVHEAFALT